MHPSNKWLVGVISSGLIASTTMWEGTRYYAYKDIVGVPTVCQGYTGPGIIFGKRYTEEECKAFLTKELLHHREGVLKCVNVPIGLTRSNAYTLFGYNVGVSGFCSSRSVKLLNAGKFKESCIAIAKGPDGSPAWSYAGGKYVQGLQNRRVYEMNMCLKGLDEEANGIQ